MGVGYDEDGGQRTRFPCLATARYVAAAVVSVLTVAVVVMVVTVALRPEKVIFSILHQHIEADPPWYRSATKMTQNVRTTMDQVQVRPKPALGTQMSAGSVSTTYFAAEKVNLRVSLTADNPSGRADIDGDNITIRVLDMPYPFSFKGLTEIVKFDLQGHFDLNRQSSHTLRKWVPVDNAAVLFYLADRYGGWSSFRAMVQVNATVTTSLTSVPKVVIHYCWPVIVGLVESSNIAKPTSCRPSEEMDSPVSFSPPLAPAPAPAPVAAAG